jgi:ABC-2 type transport system permease protein
MKSLSRLLAVTSMFLRPSIRTPILTVLVSMLPISFIIIFRLIGGSQLSRHALYGTLIVFATNVGIISMPQIAVAYQTSRLRDMFVASPVGPLMYAGGMGLSRLAWAAPGLLIIIGFLTMTGGMPPGQVPAVVLVVLFTWFMGITIGFFVSTVLPSARMIGVVSNLMGMLFSVLPPVYYPLDMIPADWRWLPLLVPTADAAQLVRVAGGIATSTPAMIAVHWAILAVYAVACGLLTLRKARWREE